ncbi:MAG: UDP-N-acetylglucosamine 2-epimerase (non-hydrolyzing) [Spirochaetales bacterium]|nr:UDP-N-acetylglucosamine 2-epimerase (non-hydrolyzing) [Spirochaetales bacterium]
MARKRIVSVVGARPQFIKAAVVSRLIRDGYQGALEEVLVHTGQHYDANMSEIFFAQMRIPRPDVNLGIGSASHGRQTGEMLAGIEDVLLRERPDWVLVYGDTNTTLAGALAAAKLNIPVAHVEAGLRSFERSMPEEKNRVVADHLSSLLFCPTPVAAANLRNEGITNGVRIVGDVMYDASLFYRGLLESGEARAELGFEPPADFYLLTLHRAENTDDPRRLRGIVEALSGLNTLPGVFPIHPRTRKALAQQDLRFADHVRLVEPVGFFEMLELERRCRFVVTDSGGVQKEAYFFGKPCITLRDQTEWTETVATGWNVLTGADTERIRAAFAAVRRPSARPDLYGDGNAGSKILEALLEAPCSSST